MLSQGTGCAGRRVQAEALARPVRYRLELELEATTTWRQLGADELRAAPLVVAPGVASPARVAPAPGTGEEAAGPEASSAEQEAALAPLSRFGARYDLELELRLARRFRDGSLGLLVRVTQAEVHPLEAAEGQPEGDLRAGAPLPGWEVAGRTFELRAFPDGEVLSVDGGLHLAGPDRLGGVVDLLPPLLSPLPPALDAGETGPRDLRWPWSAASDRAWRHVLGATWENRGRDPETQAWRMGWEGPLQARGRDGAASPPVGVMARGQGSGEALIDDAPRLPVALRLQAHQLAMQRELEVEYPAAVAGPMRMLQAQELRASLRRLPPTAAGAEPSPPGAPSTVVDMAGPQADPSGPLADARPVVRYPTPAQVAERVATLDPLLAPCGAGLADGAWPLELALSGEGRVLEPTLDGAPPAVQACVAAALAPARLPGHDEVPLRVRTTAVARAGALRTGPAVDVDTRQVPLLFVATPPELDADARRRLLAALGLLLPAAGAQTR